MKPAVFAALLYFATVGLFPQPKDSPTKNETPAAQSSPTPAPSNSDHKPADETEAAKSRPPRWYTSSEWWLVFIAALTGFAIAYQAREMVKATKLIERQAELQEANLSQWVDLKPLGLFTETTSRTEPPREVTLALRWRIVNNTSFPFTLQRVDTAVAIGLDWEHFEAVEEGTIPPAKSRNNYFDFMVPFKLTKGETKRFLDKGVALSIRTRVVYIDASGYEQEQEFGDWYDCSFPDKMEINESLGKQATWVKTEKGDDKPDIVRSREKVIFEVPDKGPKPPENPN